MARKRSGSRGDGGGASGGWCRWRSSSSSRRKNDFRGDLERNGHQQNRRDQGSAQRRAGSWTGRRQGAGGRRAENGQGTRDQSRSRREEKEDRSGWSEGRDKLGERYVVKRGTSLPG